MTTQLAYTRNFVLTAMQSYDVTATSTLRCRDFVGTLLGRFAGCTSVVWNENSVYHVVSVCKLLNRQTQTDFYAL